MTVLNLGTIAAVADDAFESTTGDCQTNVSGSVANVDNVDEWNGFRWDNVTVPAGATINSCTLSVMPNTTGNDEPFVDIAFEAADDAAQYLDDGTNNFNISGRSYNASPVRWDNSDLGADGATYFSPPDLAAQLQATIDRAGWASGQAVALAYHQPSTSATRDLGVIHNVGAGTNCATLDIDYTAGGDPEGRLIGGKLIRGGLLQGGVL